jgi:O-antigen ligase
LGPESDITREGTVEGRLASWGQRALPFLLTLLLISLTVSITAVGVLTTLLILAMLASLIDPLFRARVSPALAAPMLTFALLTLMSALAAPNRASALWESKDLISLTLFFVAVSGFRSSAHILRALLWFFGAVGFVSLYAILQTAACTTSMEAPGWVGWMFKVNLSACRATYPFRAKGFFSIYMTLGGSLMIALPLLLSLSISGPRRRRAWLLAPAVLALVALALTHVRGAWLGFAVAFVVLLVLTRRIAPVLPVALAVLVAVATSSGVTPRLLSIVDPGDPTAGERLYFWDAGIRMVKTAPLLGLGPGGVKRYYPDYKHPKATRARTGHLHSNVFQIGAEHGLLGVAAWLWIWLGFFVGASRIYRHLPRARVDERALVAGSLAAVVGFLVAGLFEYNFGDSEVIDLLWVVMAFPFVVARAAPTEGHDHSASHNDSRSD